MKAVNLVAAIPQGSVVATSLGVAGFAAHRSPGAGRFFQGRAVYIDLAVADGKPQFEYLPEGGWRDATADTLAALAACTEENKRTKTALSNNGFSVTPIDAFRAVYLSKTGGEVLQMQPAVEIARFQKHDYAWGSALPADAVADSAGLPRPSERHPRVYMVLAPIELVILSNLSPAEYAWYALHRPGKVFRQVLFTEIQTEWRELVAQTVYEDARAELSGNPSKKTKTIYSGSALSHRPFSTWVGYDAKVPGGVYAGNRDHVVLWGFPAKRPSAWDRAEG